MEEQQKRPITLTELKAMAYDTGSQINALQDQLNYFNSEIQKANQELFKKQAEAQKAAQLALAPPPAATTPVATPDAQAQA